MLFNLGLGDHLKAHRDQGFLELELGDMKDHAIYRIIAVDHDMISFRDLSVPIPDMPAAYPSAMVDGLTDFELPKRLAQDPIVMVTNPKDARFLISGREPVSRIRQSK